MRLVKRLVAPAVHLLAKFSPCVCGLYVNMEVFYQPQIPSFEVEIGGTVLQLMLNNVKLKNWTFRTVRI